MSEYLKEKIRTIITAGLSLTDPDIEYMVETIMDEVNEDSELSEMYEFEDEE